MKLRWRFENLIDLNIYFILFFRKKTPAGDALWRQPFYVENTQLWLQPFGPQFGPIMQASLSLTHWHN
jgi:hypothetical protein